MTSDKLKVSDLINRESVLPLAYSARGSSPSTLGFLLSFLLALLISFFFFNTEVMTKILKSVERKETRGEREHRL